MVVRRRWWPPAQIVCRRMVMIRFRSSQAPSVTAELSIITCGEDLSSAGICASRAATSLLWLSISTRQDARRRCCSVKLDSLAGKRRALGKRRRQILAFRGFDGFPFHLKEVDEYLYFFRGFIGQRRSGLSQESLGFFVTRHASRCRYASFVSAATNRMGLGVSPLRIRSAAIQIPSRNPSRNWILLGLFTHRQDEV